MLFNWTIELPYYRFAAGGINRSICLARYLRKKNQRVCLRFQKTTPNVDYEKIDFGVPYSVGLTDCTFPSSEKVITYGDTPYGYELTRLPQVRKVGIYMLTYGMAIEREKKNVLNQKMIVMTTTKRTQSLIEKDGRKCHVVGFDLDYENFYPEPRIERKKIAVLLYHWMESKRYEFGVKIANKLLDEKRIDGVITFGTNDGYKNFKHPKKLVRHYGEACHAEIRELFSSSSLFIMPSISEGLSLTPYESAMCGCPPVLCDGAIDDIFFHKQTCLIAEKDNFEDVYKKCVFLLDNPKYASLFQKNISNMASNFTMEKTVKNIIRVME